MTIGFLSVFTIILMILKTHGYVDLSWWIVFAPGILDLIGAMGSYVRKKRIQALVSDYLASIEKEDDSNDK